MADLAGYFKRTAQIESNGNPNAVNKGSGATGLYQFIPSTWNGLPWSQLGYGSIPKMTDPQAQQKGMEYFTNQNINQFRKAYNRDPSNAELYQMHQQGFGGYRKLMSLPDNAPLTPNMASNNPMKAKTAGEWRSGWAKKFDEVPAVGYNTDDGQIRAIIGSTPEETSTLNALAGKDMQNGGDDNLKMYNAFNKIFKPQQQAKDNSLVDDQQTDSQIDDILRELIKNPDAYYQ